jgi:5'-3' exonuclease
VRADRGVEPQSIPDYLALIGDTSDGIPGIDGWGEKSAAAVLSEYKHLEAIPRSVSEWKVKPRGADRLSESLEKHRDEAALYKKLATLRTDAPLKETLEQLTYRGPAPQWAAWCEKIGAGDLVKRPPKRS